MLRKYKVWCKNKNEWEKNSVSLLPSGVIWDIDHNIPLRADTHIVVFSIGLKDKNGNEIYDGDVVKAVFMSGYSSGYSRDWHTVTVRYDEKKAAFYPMNECEMWKDTDLYHGDIVTSIEVVGNIYENPELLTANKI